MDPESMLMGGLMSLTEMILFSCVVILVVAYRGAVHRYEKKNEAVILALETFADIREITLNGVVFQVTMKAEYKIRELAELWPVIKEKKNGEKT